MPIRRTYGCRKDSGGQPDWNFKPRASVRALPPSVDLSRWMPPIEDQGNVGTCVGHGVLHALRWHIRQMGGKPDYPLSRMQACWDARKIEGTTKEDAGCEIRTMIKTVKKNGVAYEDKWPYDESKLYTEPPAEVYDRTQLFGSLIYERVPVSSVGVKQALANGFPVVIGVDLFDSFENDEVAKTGVVPMPDPDHEGVVGGHCMLAEGYGQRRGYITVVNSWGPGWGAQGRCFLPERYVGSPQFSSDFWVIRNIHGGQDRPSA